MNEHGKRRILVWLMVMSMLPLPLFVHLPTWSIASSVWLYVSAVTGYAGLVMLLWMYILGTKSVMGLYFRDLVPVLSIHKRLGKYGTLAVFFHPVATAISYGDNLISYTLVPRLGESFERSVTWGRFALYALVVVWVTSALLRGKIAFRPWKYVHYLSYVALPLALVHVPSIGSSYRALDAPRIYFMAVLGILVLFSVLRLRHLFMLGRAKYIVTKHAEIAPDVWLIALKPTGRILTPRRGQYVYLQWSLLGEEHPFSILQTNSETGELTIAYKTLGAWTKKLTELSDGDELFLDGPYGEFMCDISPGKNESKVFIAAGIGITPFVEHLLTPAETDKWLFYANQRPETATFSRQLQSRLGNRYVSILSRVDTPAGPNDERGHIRPELVKKYIAKPTERHYYICGSEGFMQTAQNSLHELGISPAHIHTEAFSW